MLSDAKDPALTQVKPVPGLPKRISSESLLSGQREVLIVHKGREYRLRVTQQGKLILTA